MASTTIGTVDRPPSPPHLVSLVLQSKKGLQHGEQLCSRAHDLTRASTREAVDVLALDAKVRWITAGVVQQLKLAAGVAKSIAEQRERLEEEAKVWDRARAQRQDALDATLESLGAQAVPPSFHQSSLESSLFGIQHAEPDEPVDEEVRRASAQDRSKWRTLRDFVDERGIEDVLESIEEERSALDDTLFATAQHPTTITDMIAQIRSMTGPSGPGRQGQLPSRSSPLRHDLPPQDAEKNYMHDMSALLAKQEYTSAGMASHLESLAVHYDQMATALKDKEAGETLDEEDMEVFIRDTAELPSIIAELEESIGGIESVYQEISEVKNNLQSSLGTQARVLDALDSFGERMDAMLKQQTDIEMETQATYETLNDYLETLLTLRSTYETYQMSYNALVLEMDRRRQFRDAMHAVIDEMRGRLDKLRDDEIVARDAFISAHSASIPDDLCLAISNLPQAYTISSVMEQDDRSEGRDREVLPDIDEDLLMEARRRVEAAAARAQDVQDALEMPVRPRPRREDSL